MKERTTRWFTRCFLSIKLQHYGHAGTQADATDNITALQSPMIINEKATQWSSTLGVFSTTELEDVVVADAPTVAGVDADMLGTLRANAPRKKFCGCIAHRRIWILKTVSSQLEKYNYNTVLYDLLSCINNNTGTPPISFFNSLRLKFVSPRLFSYVHLGSFLNPPHSTAVHCTPCVLLAAGCK